MAELWKARLKELRFYKSAMLGIGILIFLIAVSVYTIITIPYGEAVELWKAGEGFWIDNPRNAQPSWVNLFSSKKLPETIILDTRKGGAGIGKVIIPIRGGMSRINIEVSFDYQYDDFPSEVNLFLTAKYNRTSPHVSVYWVKPNGQKMKLKELGVKKTSAYYISIDHELSKHLQSYLEDKVGGELEYEVTPEIALFAVEDESALKLETVKPMKGRYKLLIEGLSFERDCDVNIKLVVYGKVYGVAGTDHLRRDLRIAILWGAPIALAFGVTASVSVALIQMIIAAVSAWYGRSVDFLLQKATEVSMILPFLPILLMISVFYKFSIWVLLVIVVALSAFGSGVKTYRAMFLQVKELPYIEAAKAYGAGDLRIVFRYMIPKVLPTIIPSLVLSVSGFVFLEAALAMLGLGDPLAPTWGKIIEDAYDKGALYKGYYYWILEPSIFLVVTALGFALLGFALDKIFNPRLREM